MSFYIPLGFSRNQKRAAGRAEAEDRPAAAGALLRRPIHTLTILPAGKYPLPVTGLRPAEINDRQTAASPIIPE
jgi:hypothetical protein